MTRKIVGVQLHHQTALDDASRGLSNAIVCLRAVARTTNDPRVTAIADRAQAVAREVSAERAAARERFFSFREQDPEGFARCREGLEPWPDEDPAGFVGRCNCSDLCFHRFGQEIAPNGVCNCVGVKPACPQHGEHEEA